MNAQKIFQKHKKYGNSSKSAVSSARKYKIYLNQAYKNYCGRYKKLKQANEEKHLMYKFVYTYNSIHRESF